MKEIRQHIKQVFSGLQFEAHKHLYTLHGRPFYRSATKVVESFAPPFDEAYWAEVCALRDGITVHEMIHQWQTINQLACELGTETHDFLEVWDGVRRPSTPQQLAGTKFLKWLLSEKTSTGKRRYYILFKELWMYSKVYDIPGTPDLIVWDDEVKSVIIFDYKTNKDLFKSFGHMLEPFEWMLSHPYNHYQIQLSLYQVFLEEIGVKVESRQIVYLMADAEYRLFETEDLTVDLKNALNNQLVAA